MPIFKKMTKEEEVAYRGVQEKEWACFDNAKAFQLLCLVVRLFDFFKVPYHLEGGTLLGFVRDGGILEWDDDLDVSVPAEFALRAYVVLKLLAFSGWRVDKRRMSTFKTVGIKGPRIIKIRDYSRGVFRTGRVYIDVLIKYQEDSACYWQAKDRLMSVSSKYYEGFDEIEVDGQKFKVPVRFEDYLTEKYGDWRIPVKEWDCGKDEKTIVE